MYSVNPADAGPQVGGTYNTPVAAMQPKAVDTAGNSPGVYSRDVMDLFRLGISAWSRRQDDKYRQREHERIMRENYLYSAGQQNALFGGQGNVGLLGIAALVLVVLMIDK